MIYLETVFYLLLVCTLGNLMFAYYYNKERAYFDWQSYFAETEEQRKYAIDHKSEYVRLLRRSRFFYSLGAAMTLVAYTEIYIYRMNYIPTDLVLFTFFVMLAVITTWVVVFFKTRYITLFSLFSEKTRTSIELCVWITWIFVLLCLFYMLPLLGLVIAIMLLPLFILTYVKYDKIHGL